MSYVVHVTRGDGHDRTYGPFRDVGRAEDFAARVNRWFPADSRARVRALFASAELTHRGLRSWVFGGEAPRP